jgi:uncharacterized membrane protein YhaH (DUF805 family)
MKISTSDLERKYSLMSNDDFSRIRWADLSDQARVVYTQELRRRMPSEWQTVLAREADCDDAAQEPRKESLFGTDGRLSRGTYLIRILVINLATLIVAYCLGLLFGSVAESTDVRPLIPVVALAIGGLSGLLVALQAVKRLHDLNRPGTHFWLLLLPVYGMYLGILLLAKRGSKGSNRYGADPVAGQQLQQVAIPVI